MHAHASTHIASQYLGSTPLPLAGEEAVLKTLEQIGLEVVPAVAAHPGPPVQQVEMGIRTIERGINRFSHGEAA